MMGDFETRYLLSQMACMSFEAPKVNHNPSKTKMKRPDHVDFVVGGARQRCNIPYNYPQLSPSPTGNLTMESYSLARAPSNTGPEFSQKRTSSPGAPAPHTKRAKTEPGQGYSKKDKRKRRKKKKPIIRNLGLTSGLVQDVRFTSLSPGPPVPSSSYLTKDCSPPVPIASSSKAAHILLREKNVVDAPHSESKVRLSSPFC